MLALQGDFALHRRMFERLGIASIELRTPDDLGAIDGLVVPGGESSTMSMMLERSSLFDPIAVRLAAGLPAFGTCAGAIVLGSEILDGRDDQRCFGAIDISVRRNAYGRQVDSFECEVLVDGIDDPMRASFVRAPVIERVGDEVSVSAMFEGRPVVCMHESVVVATFHPELDDDPSLHAWWLQNCI